MTVPNGAGGPEKTTAREPGSRSAMNSAQPLTKPSTHDSGTYSPNGTRWILSYLPTMPRSSSRNAVLRYVGGDVPSASTEPTRSGADTSAESISSAEVSVGS